MSIHSVYMLMCNLQYTHIFSKIKLIITVNKAIIIVLLHVMTMLLHSIPIHCHCQSRVKIRGNCTNTQQLMITHLLSTYTYHGFNDPLHPTYPPPPSTTYPYSISSYIYIRLNAYIYQVQNNAFLNDICVVLLFL